MKRLILNPIPLCSCACLLLSSIVSHAQTCQTTNIEATTPTNRFTTIGVKDGEVKDTVTGLIWQRCSLGQTWQGNNNNNGGKCIGSANSYNWQQALTQAKAIGNGYRLPNIKELSSIVEQQCYDPAINTTIFPNTASSDYWSSSPVANSSSHAWDVDFNNGHDNYSYKNNSSYVRAVRSE
ncbi:Lcl C-terminal domain-containing protein [Psychrobacter sp. I-STPA10]|uniref:Lcl C-terminal domain-containing protein n=1 Tax=Psychrobacter sp. I-STPA10 TaxID=2585769 RepID=UPI001E45F6A1|nr:DUF1566 domain-containing protein [Psychrobacter sp. I-STPA10]